MSNEPIEATTLAERRALALTASAQASSALANLIEFAKEGDLGSFTPFTEDVVELLLDAAKIVMELEALMMEPDDDRADCMRAVSRYLEGWA